jgi:uncharacterized protein YciI
MYLYTVNFTRQGCKMWHELKVSHRDYLLPYRKHILFSGPTKKVDSDIVSGYIIAFQSPSFSESKLVVLSEPFFKEGAVDSIKMSLFDNQVEQRAGFPSMFENLSYGNGAIIFPI